MLERVKYVTMFTPALDREGPAVIVLDRWQTRCRVELDERFKSLVRPVWSGSSSFNRELCRVFCIPRKNCVVPTIK